MKKIFNKLALASFATVAVALFGCVNEVPEVVEGITLNRCMTPTNFTAEVVASVGNDVTLEWDVMQNAEFFDLQLFEAVVETVEDAEVVSAPDYESATPLVSVEVATDKVPYTVTNLGVDKSYYARVRSNSSVEDSASKWAYLEKPFATSAVRSSLNPKVTARTTATISIAWDNAADKSDLTSVRVEPLVGAAATDVKSVTLTAAQIAACAVTVDGLEACREYKLTLLFGKAGNRGVLTAWTRPETGTATTVSSVSALKQAVVSATGEVKIQLAYNDGIAYDLSTLVESEMDKIHQVTATQSVYIYGQSSETGAKPIIKGASFILEAGCTAFHLEDLMLDGDGEGSTVTNNAAALTAMEIVNCELTGYTKGLYSSNSNGSAEKLLFDGIYAHDINADGKTGGDFIDIRKGVHNDLVIKNSTFYACARTFVRLSDSAKAKSATLANCTFNYVTATASSSNNAGILNIRQVTEIESVSVSKCVFMNEYSDGEDAVGFVRMVRNSTDSFAPVCSGNFFFNVGPAWWVSLANQIGGDAFSKELGLAEGGVELTEDPCVNSAAGKLYLNSTSAIASSKAGDPRWWNATQPVVIRETELQTVTEPTVWNFTDKTKFDTETLTANTIIENIRIYATEAVPSQVVMSKGVSMSGTATFDAEGLPLTNAMEFRTSGVGSVKVVADGQFASVQISVGGDLYSVLADGEEHTVVLGDLEGENTIYVFAGGALTMKSIEWSNDLTPEATTTALKTPSVSFDSSKLDEGTSQAVTASWAAVENADSYDVTFSTTTVEVGADVLSYTIPAETVAALAVGEYEISVIARPVATSTKYLASTAGTASFKIEKVVVGGEKTLTWDFSSDAWTTTIDEVAALGSTGSTTLNVTIDGLSVIAGGVSIRAGGTGTARYFQPSNTGSTTTRVFKFTAPASGKLKVKASNTSGTEDLSRKVAVQLGEDESTKQEQAGGVPSSTPVVLEYDLTVTAPTVVNIFPNGGGLRIYSIEYTYIENTSTTVSWGHEEFDDIWKNGFASNTGNIDATAVTSMVESSKLKKDTDGFTYNGLSFILGGGKFKFGTTEEVTRVQFGGTGTKTKQCIVFTADGPGTLKAKAVSSGDTARDLAVVIDEGEPSAQATPDKTASAVTLEYDCSAAVKGSKIYVYSLSSGINLLSLEYTTE